MSGLREALVKTLHEHEYPDGGPPDECRCGEKLDTLTTCVIQHHQADTVLRVLAEHGDTQQVREQVAGAVTDAVISRRVDAVMDIINRHLAAADAASGFIIDALLNGRDTAVERANRAEADLAAARQQLDQVRAAIHESKQWDERGYPVTDSSTLFAILNARPASTTGGD